MTATADLKQLCAFRLGSLYLGIDVLEVREVLRDADVTMIPLADGAVDGLINLRGSIATAIELRRRLDLDDRAPGEPVIHVVVHADGEPVTLMVDAIGDVIDVAPDSYEPPPATMTGTARELIAGAYKLEGELLLVLDVERAVDLGTTSGQAS